jgi:DNA-binding response OmpR family regulator
VRVYPIKREEKSVMITIKAMLVSDDVDAGEMLVFALNRRGIEVVLLESPQQAIELWGSDVCVLAIVNESGNALNGVALCDLLRREASWPILLLTHNRDERYALQAYQAGVDECILKPIGTRLLLAKIMVWLRHAGTIPTDSLADVVVGDLRLEIGPRHLKLAEGQVVKLTNLELRLLHLLMSHAGQVLEPAVIVKHVWGYRDEDDTNLLKHVVYRLRRKLEPDPVQPTYVRTISGEGYLFSTQS